MKLHWSTRSPFARKVMVAAYELGLADRITCQRTLVGMSAPNAELMRENPLSRIPTLVLDDGAVLTDSLLICEYLQLLAGGNLLFPAAADARIDVLRRHALASGLIEILVLRRNERDRPPERRSAAHLASYEAKTSATLDAFERAAPAFGPGAVDIGLVALGCALGYLDFRFGDAPWRPARPVLANWYETFAARPSMVATRHIDA